MEDKDFLPNLLDQRDNSVSESQSFSKSSNSNDMKYDTSIGPQRNTKNPNLLRSGTDEVRSPTKFKIDERHQRFMSNEDLRMESIVESAVVQPSRRKGLKRIGTNLKILIGEEDEAQNRKDGIFEFNHRRVIYDIRSLFLFPASCKLRRWIVILIESNYFDYFILF